MPYSVDLKTIVVSEEIAKRLKNLGYQGAHVFGWVAGCVMAFPETTLIEYPAPTATEIARSLPNGVGTFRDLNTGEFFCGILYLKEYIYTKKSLNEADARAHMWLHLKRTKQI